MAHEISDTKEKYRVHWYAILTGATGHGEPIFESKESAKLTVDDLNKENVGLLQFWCEQWPTR